MFIVLLLVCHVVGCPTPKERAEAKSAGDGCVIWVEQCCLNDCCYYDDGHHGWIQCCRIQYTEDEKAMTIVGFWACAISIFFILLIGGPDKDD